MFDQREPGGTGSAQPDWAAGTPSPEWQMVSYTYGHAGTPTQGPSTAHDTADLGQHASCPPSRSRLSSNGISGVCLGTVDGKRLGWRLHGSLSEVENGGFGG